MRGVHTAIVTPFAAGELDLQAFRAQVRRQAPVHGVVVAGTTGESPTLDASERAQLLAIALEEHPCITMGVGTNDTRSSVRNAAAAKAGGAHYGLLVLPYYNKPPPEGLRAHVRAVAEVGLPLVVYHVPGRTAQHLTPEVLSSLLEIPGVVACKEATGDLTYGQTLMTLTDKPVLSGDDFTWMPLLSVGGAGVISVLSNLAPAQTASVWNMWQAGDVAGAAALHRRLYPVVKFLFSTTSPVPCKAALAAMGLGSADCRLPLPTGCAIPQGLLEGLA